MYAMLTIQMVVDVTITTIPAADAAVIAVDAATHGDGAMAMTAVL